MAKCISKNKITPNELNIWSAFLLLIFTAVMCQSGMQRSFAFKPVSCCAHTLLYMAIHNHNHLLSRRDRKAAIIDIEDWWLSVEIINRLLETTPWTWDGQLNLPVSYNKAFFERDFVELFIDGSGKELARALDVE